MSLIRYNGLFRMPTGYSSSKATLGTYRWPYARPFYADEFTVIPEIGYRAPQKDAQYHIDGETGRPLCFMAYSDFYGFTKGGWWLAQPINIATEFPGTPRAITGVEAKASFQYGAWAAWSSMGASVLLAVDDATILDRMLSMNKDVPFVNSISLDADITNSTKLNVGVWEDSEAISGWLAVHVYELWLHGEYYLDAPPPTRSVEVYAYDEIGKPVSGADVKLLHDSQVTAAGKTDANGYVTLTAAAGSYALKIYASGYVPYPFEARADITEADTYIEAALEHAPTTPIPDWVWYSIAIAGVAVGGYTLYKIAGKKHVNER